MYFFHKMMRILTFVLSATLVFAETEPETEAQNPFDQKIVGGEFARIEQYPYQLSLEYNGKLACGATLISETWVITAAHCTDGIQPKYLSIRAGSTNYEQGGEVVKVKQIHQHKDYTPWTIDYDMSLLELERAVKHKNAKPIPLVSANYVIKENSTGIVSGWGLTSESGFLSRSLKMVKVPVVSRETCQKSYGETRITERMFCAGFGMGGKDACQGDSGGPFAVDGKLAGVVSWGIGCARPKYPGVYSSVAALRDYISSVSGI